MKDNELYDFFKDRKQVFDETPGDALWSRIESGLTVAPTSPSPITGKLGLLKKGLMLCATGMAVVITWIAVNRDTTVAPEKNPGPVTNEIRNEATGVVETDMDRELTAIDSVKKKKLQVVPSKIIYTSPALATPTLRFPDAPAPPAGIQGFDYYAKKAKQKAHTQQIYRNFISDTLDLRPQTIRFGQNSTSLVMKPISFRELIRTKEVDSIVKAASAQKLLEKINLKRDSLVFDPNTVKTKIKTKPAEVTITVKQVLTKGQFDSYKEKVIRESTHPEGTIIIITAPGHKPYRYTVPK